MNPQVATISATPDLKIIDGQITTTSLQVAEHFGKRHTHVLRAIQNLLAELPEDAQPNFGLSEFTDSTGRKLPAYRLTRDGFTLLAMGFTGKEALQWKLAYITAFNQMEQKLLAQTTRPHNPAIDYDRISPAQKQDLKEIVDAIVAAGKQTHGETWARLHNKFRINSYHELPATRHLEARAYLLAKLPQPNPDNVMDAATPPPQPEETVQDMVARWVNIIDSNSRIINTQAIFQPIVDALERQSGKPPAPTADTIQAAYATAAKTAAAVQAQVFHAILQGHSPHALAA